MRQPANMTVCMWVEVPQPPQATTRKSWPCWKNWAGHSTNRTIRGIISYEKDTDIHRLSFSYEMGEYGPIRVIGCNGNYRASFADDKNVWEVGPYAAVAVGKLYMRLCEEGRINIFVPTGLMHHGKDRTETTRQEEV